MAKIGFADRHDCHGSRTSFSTHANEHKRNSVWDGEIIEVALDHLPSTTLGVDGRPVESTKVREVYNRAKYLEPRRLLLQWWADELDLARRDHIKLVA
jgi:hypothetical protein